MKEQFRRFIKDLNKIKFQKQVKKLLQDPLSSKHTVDDGFLQRLHRV